MSMKEEMKACLIANLEALLDPYMAEQGFTRRPKSLVYKRQYQGSTQSIDVTVQIHPKDNPKAAAAIYPRMEVHVPAADRVLEDMVDGNLGLLEGVTKGLSNQPIDFTSQKAEKGAGMFISQTRFRRSLKLFVHSSSGGRCLFSMSTRLLETLSPLRNGRMDVWLQTAPILCGSWRRRLPATVTTLLER